MSKPTHRTLNDLPEATRIAVAAVLHEALAASLDLRSQVKHAHWNVRGPTFQMLHELFDSIAGEADEHADLIAERALQLGFAVSGTLRQSAARTPLAEFSAGAGDAAGWTRGVAQALAAFAAITRRGIDTTAAAGDAVTADVLTEITRATDKSLWFVEAHGV